MEVMVKLTASCDDLVGFCDLLSIGQEWMLSCKTYEGFWLNSICHFLPAHTTIFCYSFVCSVLTGVDPCGLHCLGVPAFCLQFGFSQWQAAAVDFPIGGKRVKGSSLPPSSVPVGTASLWKSLLSCGAHPRKHSSFATEAWWSQLPAVARPWFCKISAWLLEAFPELSLHSLTDSNWVYLFFPAEIQTNVQNV